MRFITSITLCLFCFITAIAQKTITGTVSDTIDLLAFATVGIEGTTTGVLTDSQGRFTIEAHKGDILTISFVGYETQQLVVNNHNKLSIELINDSLDEVVVVGYGSYSTSCTRYCGGRGGTIYCDGFGERLTAQKTGSTLDINPNTIYPNPSSSGYFNINLKENYNNVDISVISIMGRVVLTKSYQQPNKKISLDLSRVATGIYIVNTIANGKKLVPQKIIRS